MRLIAKVSTIILIVYIVLDLVLNSYMWEVSLDFT